MTVLCYLLVVFLSLVLIVSLANSVNTKIENRGKEVCVSAVVFAMILLLLKFIRDGG